jgi:hypothetical protein
MVLMFGEQDDRCPAALDCRVAHIPSPSLVRHPFTHSLLSSVTLLLIAYVSCPSRHMPASPGIIDPREALPDALAGVEQVVDEPL